MGVSVRLTRNTRVYLPFWVAIPAWMIWLCFAACFAAGWLLWQTGKILVLAAMAVAGRRKQR